MKLSINQNHLLLFKAAFSDAKAAKAALQQWQNEQLWEDLDWTTRSILPLLAIRFPKDSSCFDRYKTYYQRNWVDNLIKFEKLNIIFKELSLAKIPICLLKGSAMMLYYYKNMGMRPVSSDIDILFPEECLLNAMQILEKHGLQPTSVYKYSGAEFKQQVLTKDKNIINFHHAINYNSQDLHIDVHWKISPYLKDAHFYQLRSRMQAISLNDCTVYLLSLEEQFIHTCFHGMSQLSSYQKLWWLMDVLFLLDNKRFKFDWKKVYDFSVQYDVNLYIINALELIKEINPKLVPHELEFYFVQKQKFNMAKLHYNISHQHNKYIRQLGSYYRIFYTHQIGALKKINPIVFMHFIKNYFGFSSTLEAIKHIFKQKKS